jgi:hypothetical protein
MSSCAYESKLAAPLSTHSVEILSASVSRSIPALPRPLQIDPYAQIICLSVRSASTWGPAARR